MDTSETARAIRQFLLELDPERRSKAYCKAAREYMQWAARIPREERIEQEALRQIYEQQRRGRGPLINHKKCPHRSWEWRPSSCRLRDGHHVAVEGWLPPGRADWPRHKPSSRLSLEVLLAALAVFHDLALPQTPPLMDYHEERPDSLGSFLWHLRRAFNDGFGIQSLDEPGIDARGRELAQAYLDHARARLRAEDAAIAKVRARTPHAGKERGSVLSGVLGFLFAAIVIGALEVYIHLDSGQLSQWILGHNHSLGLQLSFGLVILLGFMGLVLRNYWKWIWGTGVLAIVAVILQII